MSAQQRGLRIHEVAVDWEEDPDSRVDIVQTALGDLRGVCRLCLARPLARFVLIGALSTIAYAAMYLVLRMWLGPDGANALALACTAIANTQANRRYTFGVRGRVGLLTQHATGVVVFLLALGLTGGALGVLHGLDPTAPHVLEVIVLVVASAFATITRYAVLRSWVFATRLRPASLRTRQGVPPRLLLARPHRRRR